MKGIKDTTTGRFTKNIPAEKICPSCVTSFAPRLSAQKFCSIKCGCKPRIKDREKGCLFCKKTFSSLSLKAKFCSHTCYANSMKIEKVKVKKVKVYKIVKLVCLHCSEVYETKECRKDISRFCSVSCNRRYHCGERSGLWNPNREEVKNNRSRPKQGQYQEWRRFVLERDKHSCRLKGSKCAGILEVHHILPWKDFPEERYNKENGITLCFHHHPRKRDKVKAMEKLFQRIISSKD